MQKTWILIADSQHARCLTRDPQNHALTELAGFIHPQSRLDKEAHGRTGHAGTQFEPQTPPEVKARHGFARELADYLNKAVGEHQCHDLVLIASSPMLGELKPQLSTAAEKVLRRCITSDLTHYQGADLKARIDHALLPVA